MCQKALCNTSVLPSAVLRKKSISSQAVCPCCDRKKLLIHETFLMCQQLF